MKIHYKLIEYPAIDEHSSNFFLIRKTELRLYLYGLIKRNIVTTIYKYKIDDTYGELGHMPFFDKEEAIERIKLLKRNE